MKAHFRLVAALLGAGMFLVFGAASAQDAKWYAGGSIGQSKSDGFCRQQLAGGATRCDNNGTAWRGIGGYQITRNFAAEIGYGELTTMTSSPPRVDVKASALEATAVGTYWMWPEIGVYGKLGLFNRFARTTSGGNNSQKDQNTNWTYGAGFRYDLNRVVAFRAEWQRYNDDFTTQVYGFGVLVKF
ncbi:MAG TPA: porin family protein [Burkholderiales bacterium]